MHYKMQKKIENEPKNAKVETKKKKNIDEK